MNLKTHLQNRDTMLLDGAIGTELEKRGIPLEHDASWAVCLESHPDTVLQVHQSYVESGCSIITTNTYSTGLHALQQIDQAERFQAWNRRAVALVRESCDRAGRENIYVAGSVSAFGNGAMRYRGSADAIGWGERSIDTIEQNFRLQAALLADAGVDCILLELLGATPADISAALRAVRDLTIPIAVALSGARAPDSNELTLQSTDGEVALSQSTPLNSALAVVPAELVDAALVHHLEIDLVSDAIQGLLSQWSGSIGVYPNRTGHWDGKQWLFSEDVTPERYAHLAKQWMAAGANIIGGCCGIGPDHIAAVKRLLDEQVRGLL